MAVTHDLICGHNSLRMISLHSSKVFSSHIKGYLYTCPFLTSLFYELQTTPSKSLRSSSRHQLHSYFFSSLYPDLPVILITSALTRYHFLSCLKDPVRVGREAEQSSCVLWSARHSQPIGLWLNLLDSTTSVEGQRSLHNTNFICHLS